MRRFFKTLVLTAVVTVLSTATLSAAECYADYKAKQDNPLKLHYGVLQLNGACDAGSARAEVAQRIAAEGWTLLNVLSVFGPDGLQQRKSDAGPYYLRF